MNENPETTNAADEKQVKAATKRAKSSRDRELDDLRFILKHDEGRRLVWRYLTRCGIFSSSFTGDPHKTSFREGERNIGVILLSDLTQASPDAFLIMMKEAEGKNNARRS